jgi:hypothetical protein
LCSWHQWPFRITWTWFQKFISRKNWFNQIIRKRYQIGWHLKYSLKLTSKKNSQEIDSFCVMIKKIPRATFLKYFPYAFIFHIKTHVFVNLIRVFTSTWHDNLLINNLDWINFFFESYVVLKLDGFYKFGVWCS